MICSAALSPSLIMLSRVVPPRWGVETTCRIARRVCWRPVTGSSSNVSSAAPASRPGANRRFQRRAVNQRAARAVDEA